MTSVDQAVIGSRSAYRRVRVAGPCCQRRILVERVGQQIEPAHDVRDLEVAARVADRDHIARSEPAPLHVSGAPPSPSPPQPGIR